MPRRAALRADLAQPDPPVARESYPDVAIDLAELCRRLDIAERTFYRRDAYGFWRIKGIVELPRPLGQTRGCPRQFSSASVDRYIRNGGRAQESRRQFQAVSR